MLKILFRLQGLFWTNSTSSPLGYILSSTKYFSKGLFCKIWGRIALSPLAILSQDCDSSKFFLNSFGYQLPSLQTREFLCSGLAAMLEVTLNSVQYFFDQKACMPNRFYSISKWRISLIWGHSPDWIEQIELGSKLCWKLFCYTSKMGANQNTRTFYIL